MSLRCLATLLLLPALLAAQFLSLATTGDGSRVYFATLLRQKGTTQPDYGKLFRLDSVLALQEVRPRTPPAPTSSSGVFTLSNAFDLMGISLSSDGTVVAAVAWRECGGYTWLCAKVSEPAVTTITAGGRSVDFDGALRLSANGRWAFGSSNVVIPSVAGFRVDVSSGVSTLIQPHYSPYTQVASLGRPVANDGTLVYTVPGGLVIEQAANSRIITHADGDPTDAVIDPSARFVAYTLQRNAADSGGVVIEANGAKALYLVPVSSGDPVQLDSEGYTPSIADDGSTILYTGRVGGIPQLWTIAPDGTSRHQLTHDPAGIASAVLSGDGRVAYALTLGARLIRVAIPSGETAELIPRTPALNYCCQATAPGRFTRFTGVGFAASDAMQATIGNKPMRVMAVEPNAISTLVPLDLAVPTTTVTATVREDLPQLALTAAPDTPFDGPRGFITVYSSLPAFLPNADYQVLAVHQDWSALVTTANPAHPGEVVHAYAVGLGGTTPSVAWDAPAPLAEPFARLNAGYSCALAGTSAAVPVLYQGLAPGLIAVYQLDLRLPQGAEAPSVFLVCSRPPDLPSEAVEGTIPIQP